MFFSSWLRRLIVLSLVSTVFGRSSVVFGQDLSGLALRIVQDPHLLENPEFVKSEYENLLHISNLRGTLNHDPGSTVDASLRQKVTNLLVNATSSKFIDALLAASAANPGLSVKAYREAGLLFKELDGNAMVAKRITEKANQPRNISELTMASTGALLWRLDSEHPQYQQTIRKIADLVADSSPESLLEQRGLQLLYIIRTQRGFVGFPTEARELADRLRAKVLQTARSEELLGRLSDPSEAMKDLLRTLELMSADSATMIQDEMSILRGTKEAKVLRSVKLELLASVERNRERWRSISPSDFEIVTTILAESTLDAKDHELALQAVETTAELLRSEFDLPPWLQGHVQKFLTENSEIAEWVSVKDKDTIELAGLGPCSRTNAMVNRP